METPCKSSSSIQETTSYSEPLILKGIISFLAKGNKWSCIKWGKSEWQRLFGANKLQIKINKRRENGSFSAPQWENQCLNKELRFKDLLDFDEGGNIKIDGESYNSKEYWMYFSYYHLINLSNILRLEELISWSDFGFHELTAKNSTIWIGTAGANTPCHFDTYGWNVVIQIHGRKRWTLFPKSQSKYLYQTRVPYEESSIYSEIGFPFPDLEKYKLLLKTTPYTVDLQPGDVLIVPKHWWHFVECLDFSISINNWIQTETDNDDKIMESIAMYQIGNLSKSLNCSTTLQFFNPNMLHVPLYSSEELLSVLARAADLIQNNSIIKNNIENVGDIKGLIGYLKRNGFNDIQNIECLSFEHYCKVVNRSCDMIPTLNQFNSDGDCRLKAIVNSLIDENVLRSIKVALMERLNSD